MYQPITYSLLKSKNACQQQLDLIETHFGKIKPIPLTKKIISQFGSLFDINWAAKNLLTSADLEEYDKVTAPALEEYEKVTETAWNEYEKLKFIAWEKYIIVTVTATKEFNKVITPAWEEYEKIKDSAWEECNKVKASEFIRIYKQGMK